MARDAHARAKEDAARAGKRCTDLSRTVDDVKQQLHDKQSRILSLNVRPLLSLPRPRLCWENCSCTMLAGLLQRWADC